MQWILTREFHFETERERKSSIVSFLKFLLQINQNQNNFRSQNRSKILVSSIFMGKRNRTNVFTYIERFEWKVSSLCRDTIQSLLFQSRLQLHWQEEGVASRTPIASLDKHTIDLLSLTLEMRSYCVSVLLLSTRYRPADNNRVDYTFASQRIAYSR